MAIASSRTWTMTIDEIFDAAYARVGGEQVSGFEAESAMRNLNLLFQHFQSRRVNLWTVEERNFVLLDDCQAYTLPEDVIDVGFVVTRENPELPNRSDMPLDRMTRDDWMALPDKWMHGRPVQYWLDRQQAAPVMTVWPVNFNHYRQIVYVAICRTADNLRMRDSVDAPVRWLPAIISGLAYYIGRERAMRPGMDAVRSELPRLKAEFDEDFIIAQEEDRDNALLSFDVDLTCWTSW